MILMTKTSGTYRRFVFFTLFFALLTLSCSTTKTIDEAFVNDNELYPNSFNWKPLYPGISMCKYQNKNIPVIYYGIKIELSNQDLKLHTYPEHENEVLFVNNGRTYINGMRTKECAKKDNCVIAVNTTPYGYKYRFLRFTPLIHPEYSICGVHKVDGNILSQPSKGYSALCLNKTDCNTLKAYVIKKQDINIIQNYDYAFGGFYTVLENDQIVHSKAVTYNARTVAGVSKDNETLYLLVTEGVKGGKNKGLSYDQTGLILRQMGAWDAINMDGGSSTSLYITSKNVLKYSRNATNGCYLGFSIE